MFLPQISGNLSGEESRDVLTHLIFQQSREKIQERDENVQFW